MLNLGHTIAHAIESATNYARYRHGEAVGLGLLAASTLRPQVLQLSLPGPATDGLPARGSVPSFAAMRAPAFLAALLCAAAPVAAGDWPFYRHDLTGVSDANETLTAAQARTLQPDWIYYTHGLNYANPVVAGGLLFLTSGDGGYYVLDALTGGLRWKQYGSVLGPKDSAKKAT